MSSDKGKITPDLAEQEKAPEGLFDFQICRVGTLLKQEAISSLFRCVCIAFSLVQVGTNGFDDHTVILPLLLKTARNQWLSLWGFSDSNKDQKAPWIVNGIGMELPCILNCLSKKFSDLCVNHLIKVHGNQSHRFVSQMTK